MNSILSNLAAAVVLPSITLHFLTGVYTHYRFGDDRSEDQIQATSARITTDDNLPDGSLVNLENTK